jgi:hypothetical protein
MAFWLFMCWHNRCSLSNRLPNATSIQPLHICVDAGVLLAGADFITSDRSNRDTSYPDM